MAQSSIVYVQFDFKFCPKCTSTDVRPARRTGVVQACLHFFAIHPFRCRACRHRFYRPGGLARA